VLLLFVLSQLVQWSCVSHSLNLRLCQCVRPWRCLLQAHESSEVLSTVLQAYAHSRSKGGCPACTSTALLLQDSSHAAPRRASCIHGSLSSDRNSRAIKKDATRVITPPDMVFLKKSSFTLGKASKALRLERKLPPSDFLMAIACLSSCYGDFRMMDCSTTQLQLSFKQEKRGKEYLYITFALPRYW
jgi:hypothetical protein